MAGAALLTLLGVPKDKVVKDCLRSKSKVHLFILSGSE
jgi:hypothetical protein